MKLLSFNQVTILNGLGVTGRVVGKVSVAAVANVNRSSLNECALKGSNEWLSAVLPHL